MTRLVGIAGSLRRGSYNRALLAAARDRVPAGATLDVLSIDDFPVYNGDVEAESGVPEQVERVKQAIRDADGLVIATPEYNGGVPGVLKNAIDWLSRPPGDIPKVFHGKPVVLMGATPGGMGTAFSQTAWLQTLRHLRMRLWVGGGPFYVSGASGSFDESGLADDELAQRIADYMAGFAAFAAG